MIVSNEVIVFSSQMSSQIQLREVPMELIQKTLKSNRYLFYVDVSVKMTIKGNVEVLIMT
jgi:hypothetical protein